MNTRLDVIDILIGLAVVLMLCSLGCGQIPETTRISAPAVWSDATGHVGAIETACQAWRAVGVTCGPAAVRAEANVIVQFYSDPASPDAGIEYSDVWPVLVSINIGYPQSDDMLATVLAHEVGHALGLGHLNAGPAVMNTDRSSYAIPFLTTVDISGWSALAK